MIETIFHGHAFVEIVKDNQNILIDPFINWNKLCDLTVEDCIKKNPVAIIITHGHDDHIWSTVEIALATWCLVISTFEVINRCKEQGIENVSAQHIGWRVEYEWFSVKVTPALHWWDISSSTITWVAAGMVVYWDWKTIYHAWDTGLTKEFELLWKYESIDCAFLPIGDRFTMWIQDAIYATDMIRPRYVVPIHYNTWDLIKVDPIFFAREVLLWNFAVPKVLNPGQMIVIE